MLHFIYQILPEVNNEISHNRRGGLTFRSFRSATYNKGEVCKQKRKCIVLIPLNRTCPGMANVRLEVI